MEPVSRARTLANLIWLFMERFGAQMVTFVVSIVLARILDPDVFGRVAIIMVFITVLQVIIDSGLCSALIQKKDADDLDFSTAFIFTFIISGIAYIGMFAFAPTLARYLGSMDMVWPIRGLSVTLVLFGMKNMQLSYISRHMKFKVYFFSTLAGTIGAAVIGIGMAVMGFGIWALIYQTVFNMGIDTIILWITSGLHPKFQFNPGRLKKLYSYGWKLQMASLIYNIYNEAVKLIIGVRFTERELAFYNYGAKMPEFICSNFNSAMDGVLFPSVALTQDDTNHLKIMARRSMKAGTFIIMPLMFGLAACAEPIVILFLTDKWVKSIPYVVIFSISFMFYPIHVANLNVIKALGKSGTFLKLEIIKETLSLIALCIAMLFNAEAVAISIMAMSVICIPINIWPNRKLINYGVTEQLKDVFPNFALAGVMGLIVYIVGMLVPGLAARLIVQILVGIAFYWISAELIDMDSYEYLKATAREMIHRGKDTRH